MAQKTFDVSVYTTDWRNLELEYTLEDMYNLLLCLRNHSFIKLWNEYVNKMSIATIEFESTELLNDVRTCLDMGYHPGYYYYHNREWIALQRKWTWTSDYDEKVKSWEIEDATKK